MTETLQQILIAFCIVGVMALIAYILESRKARILKAITEVIQKIESAVQESDMGEEKKRLALIQLEAMGIKTTKWVDKSIDSIVKWLNENKAWILTLAITKTEEVISSATSSATKAISDTTEQLKEVLDE